MAGYEQKKAELEAVGAKVVAASIDPIDKAREMAQGLSFSIAHGVTRAQANQLGSWWEERRSIVQPSEFVVGTNGNVMISNYSSGPIGRIDAADMVRWINFLEAQAKK